VLASAVRKLGTHRSGEHWLDAARARHPAEAVEAVGAVLRGGVILAAAAVFYALYDQTGSSWVLQGRRLAPLPPLDLSFAGLGAVTVEAAQLQALAPALALLALPLLDRLVSPALARRGRDLSPLRKVTAGLLLAAAAFAAAGAFHAVADTGRTVSLAWQLPPYLLLACAEVLVAVTGLEWCLAGAPPGARPTIRALWSLAAFAGNLLAFLVQLTRLSPVASFLFFAVVALVFALALRHLFLRRLAPAGAPG
jgi:POT family proton-dependent oligopeptide transporter